MSSRFVLIRAARVTAVAAALIAPGTLRAQRGGGGGPDNRPEVTFPVNLPPDDAKLAAMKKEAARLVDSMSTFTQQMVDQVFSFGEPGFQEVETSKYLTGILEKNGFKITRDVAGIPTAWTATWGSGKPVISLGSDIDDIPQANQKPGVGYKDPMVTGAPGHGEGHNAGVPMNITAAIAVKEIMQRRARCISCARACSRTSTRCCLRTSAPALASRTARASRRR
jgi:aminobenzoyl-glutamate utilization protein B